MQICNKTQKIRGQGSLFLNPVTNIPYLIIVEIIIELRATLPFGSFEEITGKLKLCLLFKYKDLFCNSPNSSRLMPFACALLCTAKLISVLCDCRKNKKITEFIKFQSFHVARQQKLLLMIKL